MALVRLIALLVLVGLAPRRAMAVDAAPLPGWTEALRNKLEVVFYKEDEKAHARSLIGYTEFDASPEVVFDLVTDLARYTKYAPYITESGIVDHPGPEELIVYQVVTAPITAKRDFYLDVWLQRGNPQNGGVFGTRFTAIPDYKPPREGVVRMRTNEGGWRFEPIDGGKRTRVTYSLLSNPGGMIPKWLIDMNSVSAVSDLFKALREQLKTP